MDKMLRTAGFIPFLLVAFLNAFVDLGHKIIIQNSVFKIHDGEMQIILTAVVNGLILLPFLLLFTPAGQLSDRYRKPLVMRLSAMVAVVLTLLITASYYAAWFQVAFALTFLLAVQSAFYSPAKYGYIKELSGKTHLASANGAVQAVTIIAMLLGVFTYSWLFEWQLEGVAYRSEAEILRAVAPVGWLLVASSVIELLLCFRLPIKVEPQSAREFDWGEYRTGRYLRENLRLISQRRGVWLSIVGLALFWGISQVVLAAFPAFAKERLGELDTVVIQGVLACSGIGIALGSLLASRASRRHIETGLIPLGAFGVVVSLALLPGLNSSTFLALDFILLGMAGGIFIVPLNALIQYHAPESQMGTVLAGNNWVQNLVMFGFLLLTVLFSFKGIGSLELFRFLFVVALIGAVYTVYQLPHSLVRYSVAKLFSGRYRIRILGFEQLPAEGGVLMLGNHISWLDWAMVQIASPRPVRFVMQREIYKRWYLKWFMDLMGVIPISNSSSREALKQINQRLRDGEVVCLFPEGSISRNGQLGEFKRGYEKAVEGVDAVILPFYLRGLWGSRFSRSSDGLKRLRNTWARRDVVVAFGRVLPIATTAHEVKRHVFDLSIETWNFFTQDMKPLAHAWIDRVKQGGHRLCLADARGGLELNGYRALTAAIAFSRLIKRHSREQNIGLLLPTSSAGIITNMAGLLCGKTLVNLNYTASLAALQAAVDKAEISSIYTSRQFIRRLEQRGIDLGPLQEQATLFYLEDLKDAISGISRLTTFIAVRLLPSALIRWIFARKVDPEQPAAILFSSGSEGDPKGVMLSHRNIMANIRQVSDVLDTRLDDRVMATLPLFHAFGLTVTGLMPLIEGVPVIAHPDPTDVVNIGKAVAQWRATIFCATSTFLRLFVRNRKVFPQMLDSLRVVVAGAERLNPEVYEAFKLKFNKEIYEGYGATETTPVASVNLPDKLDSREWRIQVGDKRGTVGMPLPGGSFRVVDPDTLEPLPVGEDGLILFGGAQVMLGYLKDPEKTAEAVVEMDGVRWYKTGDKGHLDGDGFLTIVDRYSRFAKIGGEMISLGAVEQAVNDALASDVEVLATALPDEKKGERVVLLYSGDIEHDDLNATLRSSGLNPLMLPTSLIKVPVIPKLGSGKSDFHAARKIAMEASV